MRGDFFDFTPSHLVVIASNHLPAGEGGRAVVLATGAPHPVRARRARGTPDAELHTRLLEQEGPAILGWAVRGAMAVLAGGLADPAQVRAATEDYRISEDTLASFVRDECLLGEATGTSPAATATPDGTHSAEMGAEPLSAKAVGMRLTSEYTVIRARTGSTKRYVGITVQGSDEGDDR